MNNKHFTNPIDHFWSLRAEEVIKTLESSENGLSDDEAENRLKQYGLNTFQKRSRSLTFVLLLQQFKSPISIMLIAAALLSMVLGDFSDAIIILFIIIISGMLGFWQERGAANAVDELRKLVQIKYNVIRNCQQIEIPGELAVPGDIILLAPGDIIPGDSLILESKELFIDEAAFTGETYPVEKNIGIVAIDAPLSQRSNVLFMGSNVISGRAKALIVRTGIRTEFGKISEQLQRKMPETDFEHGIRQFGYMLMEITLVLVIVIFAINMLLHKPALDSFLFSLALAVGLTPQLLPAIISVNLSVGARAMAARQVIVKRISSIENFGSMNILCSDKTGTITEGKVAVKDALDLDGNHSEKTRLYAWLNASLQQGFKNPIDEAIRVDFQGDLQGYHVQSEIPYDFIRKRLSIQLRKNGANFTVTKGALNNIISVCDSAEIANGNVLPLQDKLDAINAQYKKLSAAGLRVLGLAYKLTNDDKDITRDDETSMVFLGFITLFDPPKKDAQQTIQNLHELGVQLKLITGDNALVAESLAQQIGINDAKILTGWQMREMSDRALIHAVSKTDIFAEVEPNQKERIILFLKKSGNVVGFMGDGINDAPALHAADVGISVNTAVDVAKEAADIVLLTPNLNVLITGIVEGRKTFTNTMKYVFMATSANFGNMFSMAGASLLLPFLPLLPKQILLTNLLTDFPEMTIATDRVDNTAVAKPHKWDIKFIRKFMIVFGLLSSVFDFFTFGILHYILKADEKIFQTGWFVESVISAALIVLVMRTRLPFFKSLPGKYLSIATCTIILTVITLPYLPFATLFAFVPLPLKYYGWMFIIVTFYIISAEITKQWFYKKMKISAY
ncbi:magnesium-translocating P-type ATPase [Rurimicrobium arvi]|uniref:Magnesium-transporting ATPase, P-type 1 n=1 Tax=Rurimicrobium arvi TaxID=2049916 RepID=A0ABP8MVI5_9BACT